jgi:hypothetical protein
MFATHSATRTRRASRKIVGSGTPAQRTPRGLSAGDPQEGMRGWPTPAAPGSEGMRAPQRRAASDKRRSGWMGVRLGCQMADANGRPMTARRAGVAGMTFRGLPSSETSRGAGASKRPCRAPSGSAPGTGRLEVGSTLTQLGRPVGTQHCQGGGTRGRNVEKRARRSRVQSSVFRVQAPVPRMPDAKPGPRMGWAVERPVTSDERLESGG